MLRKNGFNLDQLRAILTDYHKAGLEPAEVDMMDLAYKISTDPHSVTRQEIDKLRDDGFSDAEILDIVSAAAVRNFFSRAIDALGIEYNAATKESEPELWEWLVEEGKPSISNP